MATIIRVARQFASTRPAVAVGDDRNGPGAQPVAVGMAIHALNAVVGALNAPGGVLSPQAVPLDPLPAAAADRWQQETAVQNSHLEWTVIKPPRLTDGPAGRPVRAGLHARVGLTSRISRADLAQFFVRELAEPRFTHQTIFVSA